MTSSLPEVHSIGTSKEFDDYIKSPSIVNQVLLVHVELDQIPVCRTVNEALLALSRTDEFKANLSVCRLNADHFPEFLTSLHITAAPTVLFYHRTKLIDRVDGFNQSELIRKVQSYMKSIDFSQAVPEPTTSTTTDVEKRIQDLLHSSPVILFMKGTPSNPQCGFSRQACHLLDEHQIKFNSFDVLSDPVLREQLKVFSNWNTYPQLYVDGELIGGLDIMKQMIENGEFAEKFQQSQVHQKHKDMTKYLESLTHQAPLMLFIKGTADQPRCGFTKELIQLLKKVNITDYKTFDILQDEDVRQKLKEYSSWQTYPQVYVNGQFVGGLDVLKQLYEEDSLVETLTANRGVSV